MLNLKPGTNGKLRCLLIYQSERYPPGCLSRASTYYRAILAGVPYPHTRLSCPVAAHPPAALPYITSQPSWLPVLFGFLGLLASWLSPLLFPIPLHSLVQFSYPVYSRLSQTSLSLAVFSLKSIIKNLNLLGAIVCFFYFFLSFTGDESVTAGGDNIITVVMIMVIIATEITMVMMMMI